MNIVVCAKQVVDVGEIKINPGTNKPILDGIPRKISDIDKNAMEEAIKIKEKLGGKITTLTVGTPDSKEKIKELLAMGADEGILVPIPDGADYHVISTLLARSIEKIGNADLILFGEASIDLFSGQMGPRVAGSLNLPQLTYAYKLDVSADKVVAERNMGDKMVKSESTFPAVITVTKEINEPRLPSLMQILGSASKPIHDWSLDDIGAADVSPKVKTIDLKGVAMDRKNVIYQDDLDEGVKRLADSLAKDGVLG
ncbi:MAG: electron transfer flavoprotein subunit beta/FixA family protein [Thermoplasmatota archaeon]